VGAEQNDPMADEIISTNADEIGDFWAKAVYPYAAPIVEANERLEPDPIGSAVRIRVAQREYLAPAAHVMEGHLQGSGKEQAKGAPYSFIPEQVEIEGEVVTARDPIDLAIIPLSSASRPGLWLPRHLALEVNEGERYLFGGFQARSKSWEVKDARSANAPRSLRAPAP
jgi:hypothetical protein